MNNTVLEKNQTTNINVRIDKDTKERAEYILNDMGLSMSTAINSFLRQVITDRSLPYRPSTRRSPNIPDLDRMTDVEIRSMLAEALAESDRDRGRPADEVLADVAEEFKLEV